MKEQIKYIVSEKPLIELINQVKNSSERQVIYECTFDRNNLPEEQLKIQHNNHWNAERNGDVYISDWDLENKIEEIFYDVIKHGCKKDLSSVVYNKILATKVRSIIELDVENNSYTNVSFEYELSDDYKADKKVYSTDIKELETKMESIKRIVRYGYADEKKAPEVYLETVQIGLYSYSFKTMEDRLSKMIKRFIRNNLTYCLKKGEIIIPNEYIAKGKEGVKEWRELKSSKNKNNSMEKRMLKKIKQEKRNRSFQCMYKVMNTISNQNYTWAVPSLDVSGRFNSQKTGKLINKVFKDNNKTDLISLDEKDMLNMFKEYWKKILMDAYNAVEECSIDDNN